jgi:uncharacterized protein (DUF486 family)
MSPRILANLSYERTLPILLLVVSNVFMTFAWYWHLRFKHLPWLQILLISWLVAGLEYCFAVPANRIGSRCYDPAELKTIQEVVTLVVFAIFSATYLGDPLTRSQLVGFALIGLGAVFVFRG